jgi:hypothetical protein
MPLKIRKVTEKGLRIMKAINLASEALLALLDENVQDSREKSLSITKLEEVMFWTNKALSIQHEDKGDQNEI